ncbi:DNA-binding protein [Paraclostridium bifermentans]
MNKEEFNKLEILEQIDYINKQLENNNSITSVCEGIGVGRSTIRDRFKKVNYIYSKDLKQYIDNKCITDVTPKNLEVNNRCTTPDIDKENNNSTTGVIQSDALTEIINKSDEVIKNNLLDLVNNYDVLKDIIELHRRNTSVVKQQIVIDVDDAESKLATLRVNGKVLEQFNEFCNNNKQFKKVDLLSQAIKEFIYKYK